MRSCPQDRSESETYNEFNRDDPPSPNKRRPARLEFVTVLYSALAGAKQGDRAVFLIPARTDTRWFHKIVLPKAAEIRFLQGRLKFGNSTNSAPFPSMIVIFKSPSFTPEIEP